MLLLPTENENRVGTQSRQIYQLCYDVRNRNGNFDNRQMST